MEINRRTMYKIPWSKTDNAGGWVEVTDRCDLQCPGCYRHCIEGDRSLNDIKKDILKCKQLLNCDRIGIAGGEPLLYPHIIEVVDFISKNNMKPLLLTNGITLTEDFVIELKKAGLVKFHFHVDSGMKIPGWMDKNEKEMNKLRQNYADLVWKVGGIQCGYNITIFNSSLRYIPDVIEWARNNIQKVSHISLIAFRAIPISDKIEYSTFGQKIDANRFQHSTTDIDSISITSTAMLRLVKQRFPDFKTSTFLSGTSDPNTFKFLVGIQIGSKNKLFGYMGGKAVELVQVFYHLFNDRYFDFLKSPNAGRKIFLLSLFDKEIRNALKNYLINSVKNPLILFDKVYIQSISLQQPNEFLNGRVNLCDGCLNMMVYKDKLIHSCQLDEYRMFGDTINPVIKN